MANPIPNYIVKRAIDRKTFTSQEMEQARTRINKDYHDFLIMLPQSEKLDDKGGFSVKGEAENLGVYSAEYGTYMSIEKPYMTVDGRVQMARDEHKEKGMKLNIYPPEIAEFGEISILSVKVESEIYGTATGTIEIGKPSDPGKTNPIDKKNPISNAQTSAIGRALGFLGYGLIGTGILATPEEMEQAKDSLKKSLTTAPESVTGEPPTNSDDTKSNSNLPLSFRVQILDLPVFNRDGSSTLNIKLVDSSVVSLVIPLEQKEFAKSLKVNDVINIEGWLNQTIKKLNVAKYSTSTIEKAS